MFDIAILVLLYNKEIESSETLQSIIKSKLNFSNAKIVVWNNGPYSFIEKDVSVFELKGYSVVIRETLNNESLSVIYNSFISESSAKKYIILDDDSTLNEDYISASNILEPSQIGMPVIKNMGRTTSPKINKKVSYPGIVIKNSDKVATIGSGLVLGEGVVRELIKNYGAVFDERFYFYGIDTTFCFRVFDSKMTDRIRIISGFEHRLSRLQNEEEGLTEFRRLERSYDLGLTLRYYNYKSLGSNVNKIRKLLFQSLFCFFSNKKSKISFIYFCKAFLTGKHYRNK